MCIHKKNSHNLQYFVDEIHEMCYYQDSEVTGMLANRLRSLRRAKGLTQQELAGALEISASAVGMYEQGRREPDNETLTKFCRFFGVPSDYLLLDGAESPAGPPELGEFLEDFRRRLLAQEGLMFNGVPLTEEEITQVVSAIEVGASVAVNKLGRKSGGKDV